MVDGVLVHEMLHTSLMAEGRDPKDAGADWYAEVAPLSPAVHGEGPRGRASPRRSVRIPNLSYGPDDRRKTVVRKVSGDAEGIHAAIARWPVPFRPAGYDSESR